MDCPPGLLLLSSVLQLSNRISELEKNEVITHLYNISATAKYTTKRSLNLRLNIFHSFSENIKKIKVPILTTILIPEKEQNISE